MINRKKFIVLARSKKRILAFLVIGIILLMQGTLFLAEGVDPLKSIPQDQRVLEWRKDRDEFFKTHERSPLERKKILEA